MLSMGAAIFFKWRRRHGRRPPCLADRKRTTNDHSNASKSLIHLSQVKLYHAYYNLYKLFNVYTSSIVYSNVAFSHKVHFQCYLWNTQRRRSLLAPRYHNKISRINVFREQTSMNVKHRSFSIDSFSFGYYSFIYFLHTSKQNKCRTITLIFENANHVVGFTLTLRFLIFFKGGINKVKLISITFILRIQFTCIFNSYNNVILQFLVLVSLEKITYN